MTTLRCFSSLEKKTSEMYRRRSENSNWKKDKVVVIGRLKILHEKLTLVYMSSEIGYILWIMPPRFRKDDKIIQENFIPARLTIYSGKGL